MSCFLKWIKVLSCEENNVKKEEKGKDMKENIIESLHCPIVTRTKTLRGNLERFSCSGKVYEDIGQFKELK